MLLGKLVKCSLDFEGVGFDSSGADGRGRKRRCLLTALFAPTGCIDQASSGAKG